MAYTWRKNLNPNSKFSSFLNARGVRPPRPDFSRSQVSQWKLPKKIVIAGLRRVVAVSTHMNRLIHRMDHPIVT